MSKSLLNKITSSFAESTEQHTAVDHVVVCQRLIGLALLQAAHSNQTYRQLATTLIRIAEHSIGVRDMQTLTEVSEVLLNLQLPEARQAGTFYYALAMKRKGQADNATSLLEKIADDPTAGCRARAMQTLGVMHHEQGNLDTAARFYVEAMRAGGEHELITVLSARVTLSAIKSANGDHNTALSDLEEVFQLFRLAAKQYPFSFYVYHNALAVEFGELGRIDEAQAACAIALASPFASAYPEWSDTRDEIAAKRTDATPSVVAINRVPEAEPERTPQRSRLRLSRCLQVGTTFFQRPSITIAAIADDQLTTSILDRLLICTGPRAPPALF